MVKQFMEQDTNTIWVMLVGALCIGGFLLNLVNSAKAHLRRNEYIRQQVLAKQRTPIRSGNVGRRRK